MSETKLIYLLTGLKEPSERNPDENQRTWAWYSDKDSALLDIRENAGDMHECYYSYLVLEAIPEGPWPNPVEPEWFEWKGSWVACACPEKYQGVCNFAIG